MTCCVTWKSYRQDRVIKLFFLAMHKQQPPSPVRMDKLKLLIYQHGHRVTMKELYDNNWAFGTQVFLNRELHKVWSSLENIGRSFEVDMNPEEEYIMLRCLQYYSRNSPLFTGKGGSAAFPREFLEKYLNKTLLYEHSPGVSIQIHIVEPENDMKILTYSFGTLATILKDALHEIDKDYLRAELMQSVGNQLKKMFELDEEDLERAGFQIY
jgi:hypothetical protein